MPKLANINQCTGCLACKDACNKNAISVTYKDGHIYPSVNTEVCIDCGRCEKSCPDNNPINLNSVGIRRVFGGWCKDAEIRRNSASGGAFSAMALHMVREGGMVVGASLHDDGSVTHSLIASEGELPLLQKSKYVQSDASGAYRDTKKALNDGYKILFSGTPCQIGGLNSFLKKEYENLITVDVVCNGVPSSEAIDLFMKHNDAKQILSYRSKDFGWHDIFSQGITWKDASGEINAPLRNRDLFYRIFSCGMTHRMSCCDCKFCNIPRYADITIADFWGIKRFDEEWQDGVSLIIANNEKGERFLKECEEVHLFESSLSECIAANPRLVNGRKYHSWHPVMRYRGVVRKVIGEKCYLDLITNKYPWRLLWGALKVLTIISNKRAIKKALR